MKTVEELKSAARKIVDVLFSNDVAKCTASVGCLHTEEQRALTSLEKRLGWVRRPYDAFDPNNMCLACRAYWYATMLESSLSRLKALNIKYKKEDQNAPCPAAKHSQE